MPRTDRPLGWLGIAAAVATLCLVTARKRAPRRPAAPRPYDSAAIRILILGGGFGGLGTVRGLAHQLRKRPDVAIRLVDRSDSRTFWPMVPEVIPGTIAPAHIVRPLREEVGPLGVEFVLADVIGGELEQRTIQTDAGTMAFDKLVIALGWQTAFFDTPGARAHCLTMQTLGDAVAIRSCVIGQFEAAVAGRAHDLRFVIVGGGASGVEVAAAMAELIDRLRPQYPTIKHDEVHLVVVGSKDDILPHMDAPLRQVAARRLRADGIELRQDSRVASVDERGVVLETGDRIDASTVIWTAGVAPSPVARRLSGVTLDDGGKICVDAFLRVGGHPGIYALGDGAAVHTDSGAAPPTAQAAVQEAELVARNLAGEITGGDLRAFRYQKLGQLVELGGRFAVSEVVGFQFSGRAAHLIWRAVYLSKIGDWQDRLGVVADWAAQLFSRSVPRLRIH